MHRRRKVDWSLLFFSGLSAGICFESYGLGIGKPSAPLPGLFPFLAGLFLGGISGGKLIFSLWSSRGEDRTETKFVWQRVLPVSGLVLAYILVLEGVGFFLTTFIFVLLLLKTIEAKPWWVAVLGGVAISFALYFVFRYLLHVQLPSGFLGF